MNPRISVCILAYNRAKFLSPLLESVMSQKYDNFDVVICEDSSPERESIRAVVRKFDQERPGLIHYYENESNLGFDGNLRNLFNKATGDYCLIMGNDDLLCLDALSVAASAISRYDNIGVLLRSYAWFDRSPQDLNQTVRYFRDEMFFPAGLDTVTIFYRRVGALAGIVIQRAEALKYSTDQFDGTLFYQMYLVANILLDMNGVYVPQTLALCRNSEPPDFGNSPSEKGRFVPGSYSLQARLNMTKGVLDIARYVEQSRGVPIYKPILRDIGNYSYSILAHHSHQPLRVFARYYYNLAKMGFWANPLFHLYFLALLIFGSKRIDRFIRYARNRLGHTPLMGNLSPRNTTHGH